MIWTPVSCEHKRTLNTSLTDFWELNEKGLLDVFENGGGEEHTSDWHNDKLNDLADKVLEWRNLVKSHKKEARNFKGEILGKELYISGKVLYSQSGRSWKSTL